MLARLRALFHRNRRAQIAPHVLSHLVLEHASAAVAVLQGEALRVAYINPAAKAMVGIEHAVIGEPFEQVIPSTRPETLQMLRGVLRTGQGVSLKEIESESLEATRGTPSYLNIDCFPLSTRDNGRVDAVVMLVQDITEQVELRQEAERRAQEIEAAHHELSVREQQLRLAASSAPQVLYARDRNLRLTWAYNPHANEDLQTHLGKTLDETVHPEDAHILEPLYREVMATGQPREKLMKFHYSALFKAPWKNIYVRPLRDEHETVVGVICSAFDVTELMEVRAALAEREALLELALEIGEMGAWEYDPRTERIRYSGSLAKIYGLERTDQGVLRVDALRELVHPEDLPRLQQGLSQALVREGNVAAEFRIVRADQALRWIAVRARVILESGGQRRRIIGVTIDVTEEKRVRDRLEAHNRALERFARTVAHDLKSPLQVMMGFGGLVGRSAKERLSAQEQEHLEHVLEAGQQMKGLIEGILAYARAMHTAPVRESVDLEHMLAQVLKRLRLEIERAEAEVTHDPLPTVTGNPVLLAQVLQNLIANALKFCVGNRPLAIHVSAEQRADEWVVHVHDNGIGIAPAQQTRLFEAFSRVHSDGDYEGVGLGLSLVREAVEHHGGRIWVASAPGEGSTFSFSIPAASTGE